LLGATGFGGATGRAPAAKADDTTKDETTATNHERAFIVASCAFDHSDERRRVFIQPRASFASVEEINPRGREKLNEHDILF
jgi:hypothetical protein